MPLRSIPRPTVIVLSSLRLDVGRPDHLGPLFGVLAEPAPDAALRDFEPGFDRFGSKVRISRRGGRRPLPPDRSETGRKCEDQKKAPVGWPPEYFDGIPGEKFLATSCHISWRMKARPFETNSMISTKAQLEGLLKRKRESKPIERPERRKPARGVTQPRVRATRQHCRTMLYAAGKVRRNRPRCGSYPITASRKNPAAEPSTTSAETGSSSP
jgi:hypothetical protein